MALALNIGKCTLLGNYRENNEDAIDVKVFPDLTVCLVADGMGGQAAGEVASKRAIEIIPRELKKHITGVVSNDETKSIIRRAILQANEEIIAMAATKTAAASGRRISIHLRNWIRALHEAYGLIPKTVRPIF